MNELCIRPEDLESVARMPSDDPRRAHLETCPRCFASYSAYQEFLQPDELPPQADAAAADRRLAIAIEDGIHGRRAEDLPAAGHRADRASHLDRAPAESANRPESTGPFRRIRDLLRVPSLRPVWAVAAIVLLLVAARRMSPNATGPESIFRGRGITADEAIDARARSLESGGVQLDWNLARGTERAVLVFYLPDLSESERREVGLTRTLVLSAEGAVSEPGGVEAIVARPRYWRVLCLDGPKEIARSRLQELPRIPSLIRSDESP